MKRFAPVLAALLMACGDGPRLDPPPDLEAFDRVVRDSYLERRATVERRTKERAPSPERASALAELGHWYTVYGFSRPAEKCYRRAAELDPGEARWPYFLGHVLQLDSQLEAARHAFASALELAPDSVPIKLRLADLEWEAGRLGEVRRLLEEVLAETPDSAFARARLGRLELEGGNHSVAAEHFEQALEAQPAASALFYPLSRAYRGLGEHDREQAVLARAPDENRARVDVVLEDTWLRQLNTARGGVLHHVRAGKAARRAGNMAAAFEHFRKGVAADEENIDARLELAISLGEMGRFDAAVRELRQALEAFPENARVHFFLGTSLLRQRSFSEAEHHLRASLALDASNATVHFNLAQVLRSAGRPQAAIEHYQKAQELNPRMERAAFWQATSRLAAGEPLGELIAPLESAHHASPDGTEARSLLARVRALLGEPEEALSLLQGLGSHHVLSAETMAMVWASSGDLKRAVAWQSAALQALEQDLRPVCADDLVRRRLETYRAGRSVTEPWSASEVLCEVSVAPPTL